MTLNPDTADEDATREAVEGFGDWTEDDLDLDEGDSGPATRGGSSGTFLTDLDETLRGAGLTVREEDGWKGRSNRKGGYDGRPIGIIIHHTAGVKGADAQGEVNWILNDPDAKPISNLYLDRKGTWWVLAAGGTNTNGRGGPWGPIPYRRANNQVIGIEGGNSGTGEPWPEVMQDSYVKGVAALADRYGIDGNNILSHYEWRRADNRPDKKWDKHDPAGPSRFGSINRQGTWDMNKFRAAVNEARKNGSKVKVVHTESADDDDMYVIQPGDAWWSIAEKTMGNARATWESLAAANGGQSRVLIAGQVLTIPGKGGGGDSANATGGSTAEFPGEARRGMTGPVVVAWQEALIAHKVIADTVDNRDGDYGEGMEKAVLKLQQSWDWSDADGIAGSGTWKKLQS